MATITAIANPQLVTAPDTNENIVVFHTNFNAGLKPVTVAHLEIVSGTFNFNSFGQAAANGGSYTTAGTKVDVSFDPRTGISFKATGVANTFKISF